jgi:hypothetical protein
MDNTLRSTGARSEKPSWLAPAGVKSITRPKVKGPRSLMRTVMERPDRPRSRCDLCRDGDDLRPVPAFIFQRDHKRDDTGLVTGSGALGRCQSGCIGKRSSLFYRICCAETCVLRAEISSRRVVAEFHISHLGLELIVNHSSFPRDRNTQPVGRPVRSLGEAAGLWSKSEARL